MAAVVALQAQAGESWKHITRKDQPLLPGDDIQMIKPGPEKGQIWIGTLNGAIEIKDGVLRPLKAAKDLKVWDVTKRPEGGLWIGHGGGALLVDGDRTVATIGGQTVGSIQLVGTQLWAIAKNEATDRNTLMQANGEHWAPVALFKDRRVLDLLQDAKGTFWLVLDGDGVIEIDPKQKLSDFRHHLPRMNVTSILTDSKGRTWCGLMSGGVMVRQDNARKGHLGGERTAVLTMLEDADGKTWAATSGNGVWVSDGANWKGMLQDEGSISVMKMTSDKRVWVTTGKRGGLRYWDGKEWKESLESGTMVRCLTELPNGVLIAGGTLDGLYILGDYNIKGE
jgi:ligand-binding sensor domain-containing protein